MLMHPVISFISVRSLFTAVKLAYTVTICFSVLLQGKLCMLLGYMVEEEDKITA